MITNPRKILVTSALPYANGDIHLGHMLEYIQTDVWVRFQKMRGHECLYICGSDAHGTPIMLSAERQGTTPEALVAKNHQQHKTDCADFHIEFDNFYTTHSSENQALAEMIYTRLKERGDIITKTIQQAYDPLKNMFLPDRFVKGECPRCGTADQYGDNCEACGATYSPTELKNPVSVLSGAAPIQKESVHYFFDLPKYETFLKQWAAEHLQEQMRNKLDEWFAAGLQTWDISRDAPYFGFEIPGEPGKYFYVWLDAPIGYIASFKNFCAQQPSVNFDDYWQAGSAAELYHFVGKDILYFHALFWPAMLHGANLRTPNAIFAHGFLTVNGQKMSKSRGTFIKARTYLEYLNAEYLRYYFSAKLNSKVEDIDLNLEDFAQRVNADLVGKVVNIASRCASFITNHFSGQLAAQCSEPLLLKVFTEAGQTIAHYYETREYGRAVREIMELADKANQYINDQKPWALIKQPDTVTAAHEVCTLGINLFKILITYLKPILPVTAAKTEAFLNIAPLIWEDSQTSLTNHFINPFSPLLQRIEMTQITAMQTAAKTDLEKISTAAPAANSTAPFLPQISIDDFAKIDLRIAKIIKAEHVPEAEKLVKLTVDIGSEMRQIFAGIKTAFTPEELEGQLTVVVANLAPRKMRFGISEGMVIVASDTENGLYLINPQTGAVPGMRVK